MDWNVVGLWMFNALAIVGWFLYKFIYEKPKQTGIKGMRWGKQKAVTANPSLVQAINEIRTPAEPPVVLDPRTGSNEEFIAWLDEILWPKPKPTPQKEYHEKLKSYKHKLEVEKDQDFVAVYKTAKTGSRDLKFKKTKLDAAKTTERAEHITQLEKVHRYAKSALSILAGSDPETKRKYAEHMKELHEMELKLKELKDKNKKSNDEFNRLIQMHESYMKETV